MAKRKLSKHQKSRIDKRQQQHVKLNEPDENRQAESNLGPKTPGIVTCHFGQQLEVESVDHDQPPKIFRCFQRSNLPPLVCGDRVIYQQTDESSGVVVALEERNSIFSRPTSGGELRPVASNIDLVLIVIAPVPQPFMNLVDRYLVAIETLNLTPIIVVNKKDLQDSIADSDIEKMKALYSSLGYKVLETSAKAGNGMSELKENLKGKTAVIVGQSGVGKSSLINALSPDQEATVGSLSVTRDKGTHTTTAAQLFHLDGCDLIDSPGIREFGLWHINQQQLLEGFIEFRPFLGLCKFRDCNHTNEPECALQDALNSGVISKERMDSYFLILGSLS
jgi:ribosome biogenesis GTPase